MEQTTNELSVAKDTTHKLLAYCQANDWAGYDPYDALNSRVFKALPFLDFKIARLILTQGVKRCPINLRPLLLVPRTANPKGIALFLSALTKLSRMGLVDEPRIVGELADKLLALRSPDTRYYCWGYNFDWQTRTKLVPEGFPNIICSTFAANALLDAYEQSRESAWLEASVSAADFILDILLWRPDASKTVFTYTQLEKAEIHNANLLGSALLCRIGRLTGQARFREPALAAARYSVGRQHPDGSWDYGELPSQRWIDNFHTGFNLVALKRISDYGKTAEFDGAIHKGLEFYKTHFFRADGAPKYFHNAVYPIDIHSVSQSIITLVAFEDAAGEHMKIAQSALKWALANMWDVRGYFYFQALPNYKIRIPFMRWSQAWMLLALATMLEATISPAAFHSISSQV